MGVLYIPYLAQRGVVSLRESENVCRKKGQSDGRTGADVVLLLRTALPSVGIQQGRDQDGSAHPSAPLSLSVVVAAACSLCPQELLLLPSRRAKAPPQ